MKARPIEVTEIKSLLVERVGFNSQEAEKCMGWSHPNLVSPLKSGDEVLAELTQEEQGFFRCIGYAFEEKKAHPLRLTALHDTFWTAVKNLHNLPPNGDLAIKEGRYLVAR